MTLPEDPFAIFDPWGTPGTEAAARRWSSARRPRRRPPVASPDPVLDPAGFLRYEGMREARRVASRVERAGHFAAVQDLTDLREPALRLLLWPRPDLVARRDPRSLATLSIRVRGHGHRHVVARHWVGAEAERTLAAVRVRALDVEWIRKVLLDFVEETLAGA